MVFPVEELHNRAIQLLNKDKYNDDNESGEYYWVLPEFLISL